MMTDQGHLQIFYTPPEVAKTARVAGGSPTTVIQLYDEAQQLDSIIAIRATFWSKIPDWTVGCFVLLFLCASVAGVVYVFCNDVVRQHLHDFIGDNNVWVVVVAALGIFLWYINGQFKIINGQFQQVNARLDDMKEVFSGRLSSNDEAVRLLRQSHAVGSTGYGTQVVP